MTRNQVEIGTTAQEYGEKEPLHGKDAYQLTDGAITGAAPLIFPKAPEATQIVGWAVHGTSDLSACAMYPLAEKAEAFDAAKRWGANITALCLHPDAPTITEAE